MLFGNGPAFLFGLRNTVFYLASNRLLLIIEAYLFSRLPTVDGRNHPTASFNSKSPRFGEGNMNIPMLMDY